MQVGSTTKRKVGITAISSSQSYQGSMIADASGTRIGDDYTHVNRRLYERCRHGLGPTTRGRTKRRPERGWSNPDRDGETTGDQPTHAQPTRNRPAEHDPADTDSALPG